MALDVHGTVSRQTITHAGKEITRVRGIDASARAQPLCDITIYVICILYIYIHMEETAIHAHIIIYKVSIVYRVRTVRER